MILKRGLAVVCVMFGLASPALTNDIWSGYDTRDIREIHQRALREQTLSGAKPVTQVDRRVRLRALAQEAKKNRDEPAGKLIKLRKAENNVRPVPRPSANKEASPALAKISGVQSWSGPSGVFALDGDEITRAVALARHASRDSEGLRAVVSLSRQNMILTSDGYLLAKWPVSTGRKGYETTLGKFSSQWLSRNHRSSQYDGAPMPCSVFFHQGEAFHGTNEVSKLGKPASHGCVRLETVNACMLYDMVEKQGTKSLDVVIER